MSERKPIYRIYRLASTRIAASPGCIFGLVEIGDWPTYEHAVSIVDDLLNDEGNIFSEFTILPIFK